MIDKWIDDLKQIVGLGEYTYATQEEMLEAIKGEIALLAENEEEGHNYYKNELKLVSNYYRRRVKDIAKLSNRPARDPQERLAQVWRNCDEILRDRERSARFLTALDEEEE